MKIAVVFVHGFTGGEDTWKNSEGSKFSEMLQQDKEINSNFEFFEFTYFTKLVSLFTSSKIQKIASAIPLLNRIPGITGRVRVNQPIAQLSEQLATFLYLELGKFEEVVLIGHSMGGLIAKDHILNYASGHGPRPIGYISIAVPHKGSISALILGPLNNVNAKELTPLSSYNDTLNNRWIEKKKNTPPTLYMQALHDECVVKESCLPYTVEKSKRPVFDHDHSSICKPNNTADLSYVSVKKFLKDLAYNKNMNALSIETNKTSTPDYNKEIFVLKMIVCDIGSKGISDAKDCFFNTEIISKAANKTDLDELISLQSKVLSIYQHKYNSCIGKNMTANEVFSTIHEEIMLQDSGLLKSTVEYFNFLHKKGLLHKLANQLNDKVIWDDNTNLDEIKRKTV